MKKYLISSGSTFEAEIGYSRAVVEDPWVFVPGTTGFDYATMAIAPGVAEQAEQCFKNIAAALEQAGSCFGDVVRVTYVLPDATEFVQCWPVLRKYFGDVRPAARPRYLPPSTSCVPAMAAKSCISAACRKAATMRRCASVSTTSRISKWSGIESHHPLAREPLMPLNDHIGWSRPSQ